MTSQTSEFFAELGRRGHEPLLRKATGVIRFEIVDEDDDSEECWVVSIDRGDIEVSQREVACDCKLRVPKEVLEEIARGDVNPTTAVLRGAIGGEGDWRLLVLSQRLFRSAEVAQR